MEKEHIPKIDGYSLVPMMKALDDDGGHDKDMEQDKTNGNRPNFVISQFHGCNIAMSWFFIVQPVPCNNDGKSSSCLMKYIRWGTGKQVKDQLFDLTNDPDETKNLIEDVNFQALIPDLDANLKVLLTMNKLRWKLQNIIWKVSSGGFQIKRIGKLKFMISHYVGQNRGIMLVMMLHLMQLMNG